MLKDETMIIKMHDVFDELFEYSDTDISVRCTFRFDPCCSSTNILVLCTF